MTMRNFFFGLLAVAFIVGGAAWFASRSPGEAEVQRAGRTSDPIAPESAVAQPGAESSTAGEPPAPAVGEMDPTEPTRTDREELVTLDPPPPTAGGPVLETTGPATEVTARDELVSVPVDPQAAPAGRPELEIVPADPPEAARRDERTDAPVPGQGNTSTR
jgi:hypothetical protein